MCARRAKYSAPRLARAGKSVMQAAAPLAGQRGVESRAHASYACVRDAPGYLYLCIIPQRTWPVIFIVRDPPRSPRSRKLKRHTHHSAPPRHHASSTPRTVDRTATVNGPSLATLIEC
ncbi:unnamed protein product [Colias eurytheme]|nr:unnamed protein product [Colias eurytheme]